MVKEPTAVKKPQKAEKSTTDKTAKVEPAKSGIVTKDTNKSVIIAVLATALVCIVLIFGVLLATGVIKFSDSNNAVPSDRDGTNQARKNDGDNKKTGADDDIISNPNQKVKVNGNLVSVKDLEFYLPKKFEAGGQNNDGAYTYNLTNDDGWAQVLVYAEKTNLSPEKYLLKVSPYLDITDDDYDFNGTEWVVGETGSSLAYATELDGTVYVVYYSVKLDSGATSEAMQMIPKTLYMNKIYADDAD